jgi:hypothetical protein
MKDSTGISVILTPVFGISIPVIIRVGPPALAVSLTDISLDASDNAPPRLNMVLHRTGNHSVYGDISIDHVSEKGKTTTVGTVKGLAVYTPNPFREFHMELAKKPGVNYHRGKLRITYSTQSKGTVSDPLAQAELLLH